MQSTRKNIKANDLVPFLKVMKPKNVINHLFTKDDVKHAIFAEQDAPKNLKKDDPQGQVYYYIGEGLAYTTRVHTCTALAVLNTCTNLAYLSAVEVLNASRE